jgi:hypothetical protein
MTSRRAGALLALLGVFSSTLLSKTALAQTQPTPAAPAGAPSESQQDEARSHFALGLSHFDREEWAAALVEFLKSRELFPSKGNTKNAAICLRKVGRYDESLDMFEKLLHDFSDLSPTDRTLAQTEIAELQASVGTIELRGAPTGATISIDGIDRGKAPLKGAMRLSAGTHNIRVTEEGALPFEARVDLAGKQNAVINVRLTALTQAGTLHVVEHAGGTFEVVIDGAVVGKTPWEGALAPGDHTVLLRGEGDVGTSPIHAVVRVNEVVNLDLPTEHLGPEINIKPQPASADVTIDGVDVGRGPWKGRLRKGSHQAVVKLDGYTPYTLTFTIGETVSDLDVHLEPAVIAGTRAHVSLELDASLALGALWGGDLVSNCSGSCSGSLPIGFDGLFHGTYNFSSGFGLGIHAGYLLLNRSIDGRADTVTSLGRPPSAGTVKDALRLGGFAVGADAQFEIGNEWPLTLRLGIGALIASIKDSRTGNFVDSESKAYSVDTAQSAGATYLYVAPEIRFGRRFGEHFELNIGTQLLVLAGLKTPSWDTTQTVGSGSDGIGTFPSESLSGGVMLALTSGIGAKYEF